MGAKKMVQKNITTDDQDTLTRARLAETLQDKFGATVNFSKKSYLEFVDTFFDELCATLIRGESVKISSFGSFLIKEKSARMGRNPKTGKEATISARRVISFRPSQTLKLRINLANTRKG